MTRDELADRIVTVLFTNNRGDVATRLVLATPTQNLGGWSKAGARAQIMEVLQDVKAKTEENQRRAQ
jgi:hypothetical protein